MARPSPLHRSSTRILLSVSLSLTTFWVLNLLKEAFPAVKSWLNFAPSVGPLLGLFLAGILALGLGLLASARLKPAHLSEEIVAFLCYIVSVWLFFLMVFPPIYEPIVELIR